MLRESLSAKCRYIGSANDVGFHVWLLLHPSAYQSLAVRERDETYCVNLRVAENAEAVFTIEQGVVYLSNVGMVELVNVDGLVQRGVLIDRSAQASARLTTDCGLA